MLDFENVGRTQKTGNPERIPVNFKQMTGTDMLTDVGWLGGTDKSAAIDRYLSRYGQYYDNGERVVASC